MDKRVVAVAGIAVWGFIGVYATRTWILPRLPHRRYGFGGDAIEGIKGAHITIGNAQDGIREVHGDAYNGTNRAYSNLKMQLVFSSADTTRMGGMVMPIKSIGPYSRIPFEIAVPAWAYRCDVSAVQDDN